MDGSSRAHICAPGTTYTCAVGHCLSVDQLSSAKLVSKRGTGCERWPVNCEWQGCMHYVLVVVLRLYMLLHLCIVNKYNTWPIKQVQLDY